MNTNEIPFAYQDIKHRRDERQPGKYQMMSLPVRR